jgi:gliding motility-associated-like protein
MLVETTTTGCIDTFKTVLDVYNIPIIRASPDTVICNLDTAFLRAYGGVSYVWSPTTGLNCSACPNPFAIPSTPTNYVVIGTDANGCTNTDTVHINMKSKVVASVDSFKVLCQNDSVALHAAADAVANFYWSPANGLSSTNSSTTNASPSATTKYMVIVKEGHCIPDTVYSKVIVYPIPGIDPGPDQTIVEGGGTTITTTASNVVSYSWSPNTGLNCDTCGSPYAAPITTTLYKVTVTSDFGCVDSGKVKVTVICDHSQVFIPNTFTPNGDGANDKFYPHGKGLQIIKSFRIYDRWGEQVFVQSNFNTNDPDRAWDGTFNGKKLTPDVYVYVIDAICETGEPISWSGDVALLR